MTSIMLNRRNFAVRLFTGAGTIALSGITTACWFTGTVFTQIMSYVGVGLTAFQAVVDLLAPNPAIDTIVALVKAGFADLQLAVQDYNNAPAANKTTLLGRISTVLADLQTEIQNFWSSLGLSQTDILFKLVEGLLAIILSTLAGFASQLPLPATVKRGLTSPSNVIPVTPQKRSKKEFEHDFNQAMIDAGKPAVKFS